jgi:hypothetical protein
MPLQTRRKLLQTPVERWRIIPERCVPRIRHHLNLRVSNARLVLFYDGWFDDGILSAMCNQYWLADFRQKIVIVERAGEQRLTDVGWNGDITAVRLNFFAG